MKTTGAMKKRKHFGVEGMCSECGKPCFFPHDSYIVRGEIWREAGMGTWDTGFLHQYCLEARIGRKLTRDDLLFWYVKSNKDGSAVMNAHPDYLSSPEYRKGLG
jgi:hypothetical protein